MNRFLILGAGILAFATCPSTSSAQTIACASEASAARGGHWYYRIIDGRKCWYQGKAMMPKESLHWPKSAAAEADTAEKPRAANSQAPAAKRETDGRSVEAPPSTEPAAAWPTPVVNNDISFESRWLGLRSGN